LIAGITALLDAGVTAGTLRSDVDPYDVLLGLSGVSLAAGEPAQRAQAGRLLDLLVDGLRHGARAG
ncbi:MAG: putative TetR family transcriptional regulator, partial [Chloroflexi bacterium]|nr:putative TetR family transcriptional regulator [Chloroflexota bacterium]